MHRQLIGPFLLSFLAACGAVEDSPEPPAETNGQAVEETVDEENDPAVPRNNASTEPASTNGNTTAATATARFADVFDAVFAEAGCGAGYCHGSPMASAEGMYDFLVDQPGAATTTCDATVLVVPGDPEASLLWLRIRPQSMDDGEPCAQKMPGGSTGLSRAKAMLVYDWILDGAQR